MTSAPSGCAGGEFGGGDGGGDGGGEGGGDGDVNDCGGDGATWFAL